jgi:hypothetical protein
MTLWSLQRHVIGSALSKISLSFMERFLNVIAGSSVVLSLNKVFFLLGGPLNQFLAKASFMTPLTIKYREENAVIFVVKL